MARKRTPIGAETEETARRVAREQLANRKRRDVLDRHEKALLAAIETWIELHGEEVEKVSTQERRSIEMIINARRRASNELAYYVCPEMGEKYRECARDREDEAAATMRVLLEMGASSYQLGDTSDADGVNSAARKRADRLKRDRRDELAKELERHPGTKYDAAGRLEVAMENGLQIRFEGPLPIDSWREATIAKIDRLSVDKRPRSRSKSRG